MSHLDFYADFLNEGIYILQDENNLSVIKEPDLTYQEVESNIGNEISKDIDFLGTNTENLAILVRYQNSEWIATKDKLVLEKILAAINLNLNNIALVNISRTSCTSFREISEKLSAKSIICFGLDPSFIERNENDKIVNIDSKNFLFTQHNLTEIAMSKDLKMILWKNLKQLFLQ